MSLQSEFSATRRSLRTPRSAAIAGILYSLLTATIMLLIGSIAEDSPSDVNRTWLENWESTISIVLYLVPLAGLALLWFTGVIRARIAHVEDRFFQTIFFGSAIMIVTLTFIWAAVFGAMFGAFALADHLLTGEDIYIFGFTIMNEIMGNYVLRMAGVYMTAIGSIWRRADVGPRWLVLLTLVAGLAFTFLASPVRETRFLFPLWVLVVSAQILYQNYSGRRGGIADSSLGDTSS